MVEFYRKFFKFKNSDNFSYLMTLYLENNKIKCIELIKFNKKLEFANLNSNMINEIKDNYLLKKFNNI